MNSFPKSKTVIIISLLTICMGASVLLGWIFDMPGLQTILPKYVAMKFNAGLCFIFIGTALLCIQSSINKHNKIAFQILSSVTLFIGALSLLQYLFNFNSGLDQFFIADKDAIMHHYLYPGRMAANTAVCFILLGLAFLGFSTKSRPIHIWSQYFLHIVTAITTVALLGYLYGISLFYKPAYVGSMAVHTAALLFLLSIISTLLHPSIGIAALFTGNLVGNKMAARIFILIVFMVVIFGSLRLQSQHFHLMSLEIGVSLLALSFLLVSLAIIWHTANWLNRMDLQRYKAEEEVKSMNAQLERRVEERSVQLLGLLHKLERSEEKYRSLIEHASDAIYILDMEGNFTDANESMCKMTGYTKEELLQLNIVELVDPVQLKTDPVVHGAIDPGTAVTRERRLMHKDRGIFHVEINVKKFADDRVLVIARDITGRKQMEAELRYVELKFRILAEKSMVGVYISQNERFIYVNPRFAEIFGYEPHELINTKESAIKIIISEDDQETVWRNVQARYRGEMEIVNYEVNGKKKDGTHNRIEFYGSRVIIDGIPSIIGSMLDVTERKKAEELILKEKTLSETVINSLPGIFYLRNQKGEYLRWNKNFEAVTGYTSEEIRKINAKDLIAEEDLEIIKKATEKVFNEGYALFEVKGINKYGIKIPYLLSAAPIMYENQLCLLGTGIDISSRIKAEEELRASEQKYKFLFESNPSPLWMIAKDDLSIIAVNDAAANLYGYTKDELLRMSVKELRPLGDQEKQLEDFQKEMNVATDFRIVRQIKKNRTIIFVNIISEDIVFEGRPVRLSLTNDVTERLKAEESLKKSEANLKTIMDTTDTAYALLDKNLNVMTVNQMAVKFVNSHYGHTPSKGDQLGDYFPKERLPQFITYAGEVLKGNNVSYEINYPKLDGTAFWYYVRLFPIINDKKEIFGLMLALSDITERKNSEDNLKAAYQRIQDHINSIKDMAWKQSHLIRSPLANLKGLTVLLKEDSSDADLLGFIQYELERMDAIIIEMAADASNHD